MVKEAMTLPAGVGSVVLAGIERRAQMDGMEKESLGIARGLFSIAKNARLGRGFTGQARAAWRSGRSTAAARKAARHGAGVDRALQAEQAVGRANYANLTHVADTAGVGSKAHAKALARRNAGQARQNALRAQSRQQQATATAHQQQAAAAEQGFQRRGVFGIGGPKAPKPTPAAKGAVNPTAVADDAAKQVKTPAKQLEEVKTPAKQLEEVNTTATTQPDASDATGLRERIGNATKWVGEKAKESPFVAMGAAGGTGVLGGAALTGGGGGGRPAPPQAGWAQPGWG